jgi:hypothetical protein
MRPVLVVSGRRGDPQRRVNGSSHFPDGSCSTRTSMALPSEAGSPQWRAGAVARFLTLVPGCGEPAKRRRLYVALLGGVEQQFAT